MTISAPSRSVKFAAIGLDHRHIYEMAGRLMEHGCKCIGYWTDGEPQPLAGFVSAIRTCRGSTTSVACWKIRR